MTETSDKVSNNIINFHLTMHFIKIFLLPIFEATLVYNFRIFWLITKYFQNQCREAANGGRSDPREPNFSVTITFSDIGDGQVTFSGTWARASPAQRGRSGELRV